MKRSLTTMSKWSTLRRRLAEPRGFTWLPTVHVGEDGALPDGWAEWMLTTVERGEVQVPEIRASHEAAAEVVRRYASDLEPFGIFLRSFDIEASRKPANRLLGDDISYVEFVNAPSAVERALVESLQEALPVITVANQGNRLVAPGVRRLPRLVLPDDEWRSAVTGLVQRAAIIVLEVVRLSPGLREELDVLSGTRTLHRSVLVLDAGGSEENDRLELQDQFAGDHGEAVPAHGPALADDPAVRAFPRVLPVDQLGERPLGRNPQFADLLFEAGHLRGLDASDRRARNDALSLADDAARLGGAGLLPEAAVSGVRALETFGTLDDVISMIGVLSDLVFITAALDDRSKARESAEWLVSAARRLSPAERDGLLYRFGSIPGIPGVLAGLDSPDLAQELTALFGQDAVQPARPD